MLEKNYSNLSNVYANKFVIARLFTQRLLKYNQYFVSDADYIKFCQVFQGHLRLSINFAIQKIKPVTFTAELVKDNYKEAIERFVTCANSF